MNLVVKHFDELSAAEIYEILRARCAVFVVEQNCPYQDIDGLDRESVHVFYEEDGRVLACLRFFEREEGVAQLGRVLTVARGTGLGGKLLKKGVELIKERLNPRQIYIEAQCYAIGYYAKEGFKVCSEEFLEDGIPHVKMILNLSQANT